MASFNTATFNLRDGDIELVSWEFIRAKLTEFFNPLITTLENENQSLDAIIAKLDSWINDDPDPEPTPTPTPTPSDNGPRMIIGNLENVPE